MSSNLAALGYLVAAICFILALRGLSSPASSRQGNRLGMIGMTIAILVSLALLPHRLVRDGVAGVRRRRRQHADRPGHGATRTRAAPGGRMVIPP